MDAVTQGIAIGAGRAIIEKVIKDAIKRIRGITKGLSDNFKVHGREMVINCPESIQNYSISFKSKGSSILSRKKKFKYGAVRRVSLRPIQSLRSLFDAIVITEDGFEINLKYLEPEEVYILDVEYKIEDPRFIKSLVYRDVARETPKEDFREYWLVAQLKHLKALKQDFGYIQLRDIDFGVNVAVHQDIKLKVSRTFRQQMETVAKLLKPIGRGDKFKLYLRLLRQQKSKHGGKELELLENLHDVFLPMTFRKFVEVQKDFHYFDCRRGKEFYETLPFPTWPKSMRVVSRTDLNFEKPASDGLLIFKRKDFLDVLEDIFK